MHSGPGFFEMQCIQRWIENGNNGIKDTFILRMGSERSEIDVGLENETWKLESCGLIES